MGICPLEWSQGETAAPNLALRRVAYRLPFPWRLPRGIGPMTKTGWLLLAALLPSTLAAQHYGLREVRNVGSAGLNLVVARPVGDFQRNVDVAGGVNVFGALNVGRIGALAIRLDG